VDTNDNSDDSAYIPYAPLAYPIPSTSTLDKDRDIVIIALPPLVDNTIINLTKLLGRASQLA
jgi:hypothetical protein